MSRFSVPFDQLVQVRSWGDSGHADWRCMVGGHAIDYNDRERAGCRYDHNADSREEAEQAAADHIRSWHLACPVSYEDERLPTPIELYGVSGHTDAIADGLDGEPKWMVNAAGRLLQDAADRLKLTEEEAS